MTGDMLESPIVRHINSLVDNASRFPWAKPITTGGYCDLCNDWWGSIDGGICRDCRTRVTVIGDR